MDKKHLESPSPPTDEHAGVQYTSLNTQGKLHSTQINIHNHWVLQKLVFSKSHEQTSVTWRPQAQAKISEYKNVSKDGLKLIDLMN